MPGDRKAIIGPNGAGKTTLFNLITGIYPVTSGQVLLFGQDVTNWPSHRRTALGMARTFQVTSLFPRLTVLDNVLLAIKGLRPSKFVMWRFLSSYKDVYAKAHDLLEQAGFLDRKDTEVRNLSHGEQRQLEIVLGLASDPKILLLDEPAAGLSSGESTEMAAVSDEARSQARDPADRARHGRGVRRGRRRSRCCISAKCWKPARRSRSRQAARPGNLSGDRLNHGDPRSPGHPHLLRRRLRAAGPVAASSSRARSSACSAATASARPRW